MTYCKTCDVKGRNAFVKVASFNFMWCMKDTQHFFHMIIDDLVAQCILS